MSDVLVALDVRAVYVNLISSSTFEVGKCQDRIDGRSPSNKSSCLMLRYCDVSQRSYGIRTCFLTVVCRGEHTTSTPLAVLPHMGLPDTSTHECQIEREIVFYGHVGWNTVRWVSLYSLLLLPLISSNALVTRVELQYSQR